MALSISVFCKIIQIKPTASVVASTTKQSVNEDSSSIITFHKKPSLNPRGSTSTDTWKTESEHNHHDSRGGEREKSQPHLLVKRMPKIISVEIAEYDCRSSADRRLDSPAAVRRLESEQRVTKPRAARARNFGAETEDRWLGRRQNDERTERNRGHRTLQAAAELRRRGNLAWR